MREPLVRSTVPHVERLDEQERVKVRVPAPRAVRHFERAHAADDARRRREARPGRAAREAPPRLRHPVERAPERRAPMVSESQCQHENEPAALLVPPHQLADLLRPLALYRDLTARADPDRRARRDSAQTRATVAPHYLHGRSDFRPAAEPHALRQCERAELVAELVAGPPERVGSLSRVRRPRGGGYAACVLSERPSPSGQGGNGRGTARRARRARRAPRRRHALDGARAEERDGGASRRCSS